MLLFVKQFILFLYLYHATVNVRIPWSLWESDIITLECTYHRGMDGSYDSSIFHILRNLHTVFIIIVLIYFSILCIVALFSLHSKTWCLCWHVNSPSDT